MTLHDRCGQAFPEDRDEEKKLPEGTPVTLDVIDIANDPVPEKHAHDCPVRHLRLVCLAMVSTRQA